MSLIPFGYLFGMSESRQEQAFINELRSRQTVSFVAEDAGRVVGFITGGDERNKDDIYRGEIYTLYVLKYFQRRGIGGKLVSALATRLNRNGIYSILVRVSSSTLTGDFIKKSMAPISKPNACRLPEKSWTWRPMAGWIRVLSTCKPPGKICLILLSSSKRFESACTPPDYPSSPIPPVRRCA